MKTQTDMLKAKHEEWVAEGRELRVAMKPQKFTSPESVLPYAHTELLGSRIEKMLVIYLDSKLNVIESSVGCEGTVDQVVIYPREIVRKALLNDSRGIILIHNHPSGDTDPSGADIRLTENVNKACEALGLRLHDHIIVGTVDNWMSFQEEGKL